VKQFKLGRRALRDLQDIWEYLSNDSFDAADRVLEDFYQAFNQLAEMPGIGRRRPDLTPRAVLFWPVHAYLIIYRDSKPLRIARIVHGRRDLKKLLKNG
jgi:plasmid stabilization system protein ParE